MADKDIQIDPRGYRFGAAITLVLAVLAIVLGADVAGTITMWVLAALFLPGALIGPHATVQSAIFKKFLRPRLGAPKETESFRAPRFAQQMGLGFAVLAAVFGTLDINVLFFVFAGFVAVASFLNSVFGFCLGCEIYLIFKRLTTKTAS